MESVRSADGTPIAYNRTGQGPVLIMVGGAMTARNSGSRPQLASLLADPFTVIDYDRRGRGDSGDTQPYTPQREIEDIEALIDATGPAATLYGHSSGGCLALDTAVHLGPKVSKLAIYEAPYNDDPAVAPLWAQYLKQLAEALAEGRRGDAVAAFMRYVGTPAQQIDAMRQAPFWAGLEAIAPTLAYDHTGILGPDLAVPAARAARNPTPALLLHGGAGAPFMRETAETLSKAMAQAELRVLDGQTHDVDPAVLAPVLAGFFAS